MYGKIPSLGTNDAEGGATSLTMNSKIVKLANRLIAAEMYQKFDRKLLIENVILLFLFESSPSVCLSGLSGGKQNTSGMRKDNRAHGMINNRPLNPALL